MLQSSHSSVGYVSDTIVMRNLLNLEKIVSVILSLLFRREMNFRYEIDGASNAPSQTFWRGSILIETRNLRPDVPAKRCVLVKVNFVGCYATENIL